MFISNQKEKFQVIHTLEERRKFSSLLELKKADRDSPREGVLKKKTKEEKDKARTTWLFTLPSRLLFFSSCG